MMDTLQVIGQGDMTDFEYYMRYEKDRDTFPRIEFTLTYASGSRLQTITYVKGPLSNNGFPRYKSLLAMMCYGNVNNLYSYFKKWNNTSERLIGITLQYEE